MDNKKPEAEVTAELIKDSPEALESMCGPRYNAFNGRMQRDDQPAGFFQRAGAVDMHRRSANPTSLPASGTQEEELERWDGLA